MRSGALNRSNFYPRPPRGGRRRVRRNRPQDARISIHALREEGDAERVVVPDRLKGFLSTPSARRATGGAQAQRAGPRDFYPRPPRGGRPGCHDHCERYAEFLSTPSARRATITVTTGIQVDVFLSTPSARRATCHIGASLHVDRISIHALREEGDDEGPDVALSADKFLSTPSARRATCVEAAPQN